MVIRPLRLRAWPRQPLISPLPERCQCRKKSSHAFFNVIGGTHRMDAVPAALGGLRAGQTGVVVLGGVIMGDIAVTLVDLVQRELLTVEETAELAGQVRSFRRYLRRLVAEGDQRALSGQLLPYAVRFGLLSDQPTPLVRFAQAWVRAFADLPGWAPPKPTPREYASDQPLFADVSRIPGAGLGWLPGDGVLAT
jgi:hypothetical protein